MKIKKFGNRFLAIVHLHSKIEFNAAACTDQHLGGGCSKTEAKE